MGAIADGFAAFAQPLLDRTDGSMDQVKRAMSIAQLCWNLALTPESKREEMLNHMRPGFEMADEQFAEFQQDVILPMIQRHIEMFPGLHDRHRPMLDQADLERLLPTRSQAPPQKKQPVTRVYDPCPCGSGRKYKWCCGARK